MKNLRTLLAQLALVVSMSFLLAAEGRTATTFQQMRLGVTGERTRLVLEFSSSKFAYRRVPAGDSVLTLVLPGIRVSPKAAPLAAASGYLREARVTRGPRGEAAVRILLRGPARDRIFRLGKAKGLPDRLVIDLYGAGAKSPKATASTPKAAVSPPGPAGSTPEAGSSTPVPTSPGSSPVQSGAGVDSQPRGPRVVIVDPGHGGGDPGATAKGLQEKDVCLDVARRLAALLDRQAEYRAILTRKGDVRIPLRERMRAAENAEAELFVSIHVNAALSRQAQGVEVFFLSVGAASDQASRELARLENEVDPDYVVPEDEGLKGLPFIVDLRQSDTMLRSSRAAEVMLGVLTGRELAAARGVKQAGFAVLKSFQVPSVLVELGFISSAVDRKNLASPAHRQRLAEALATGIREYFQKYAPHRPNGGSPP